MRKDGYVANAELRAKGEFGFEWQYWRDGSILFGRRCALRAEAIAFAEEQRLEMERHGWTSQRS